MLKTMKLLSADFMALTEAEMIDQALDYELFSHHRVQGRRVRTFRLSGLLQEDQTPGHTGRVQADRDRVRWKKPAPSGNHVLRVN